MTAPRCWISNHIFRISIVSRVKCGQAGTRSSVTIKEKPPGVDPAVLAGGKGFEPLHTDPESAVLPLDEPPVLRAGYFIMVRSVRQIKINRLV